MSETFTPFDLVPDSVVADRLRICFLEDPFGAKLELLDDPPAAQVLGGRGGSISTITIWPSIQSRATACSVTAARGSRRPRTPATPCSAAATSSFLLVAKGTTLP